MLAEDLKESYSIAAPSIDTEARLLSGGNIQRLIFAREIDTGPRVMVAVQPTRGLDVGAIEAVHRVLLERRKAGTAILLISEDLDEILALADRVDVMYEGRIVGSFPVARGRRRDARGVDDRRRATARRHRRRPRPRRPRHRAVGLVNLRLEPRTDAPRWFSGVMTLAALVVALLVSGFVIWLVGGDPFASFAHIISAAFGSVGVISDTLVKATPLILTGLACSLAFRMHLWNIGAEGQFLLGAWGASAVVLFPLLPAGTPAIVVIPVMMLAGAAAGGLWGFIPGILRARLGVSEIITTLMLNYVALLWVQYWVFGPWSNGGFQETKAFPPEAVLPRLTDFAATFPILGGLTTHLGLIFGIVAATIMWVALERTRWGYEIRLIGDSPRAARYAGINIERKIVIVFVISARSPASAG